MFTGPIPASIGQLNESLRGLYLSGNKLDGRIPESICGYVNLEALFLDENEISGTLPACLGDLTSLKQFYAFDNNLTGTVPAELSSLRRLSKSTRLVHFKNAMNSSHQPHCNNFLNFILADIGIERNGITGVIASEFCDAVSPVEFWSDCGGNAPALVCSCCTVCCPSSDCA